MQAFSVEVVPGIKSEAEGIVKLVWKQRQCKVEFFRSNLQAAYRIFQRIVSPNFQAAFTHRMSSCLINVWGAILSMSMEFSITPSLQIICYSFIKMVFKYPTQIINGFYVPSTKPPFLSFLSLAVWNLI